MGHGEGMGVEVCRGSRGEDMYGGTYRDGVMGNLEMDWRITLFYVEVISIGKKVRWME